MTDVINHHSNKHTHSSACLDLDILLLELDIVSSLPRLFLFFSSYCFKKGKSENHKNMLKK